MPLIIHKIKDRTVKRLGNPSQSVKTTAVLPFCCYMVQAGSAQGPEAGFLPLCVCVCARVYPSAVLKLLSYTIVDKQQITNLNNKLFFLPVLEAGSLGQGASMVGFWQGLSSQLWTSNFLFILT
jgi:hypothetical protein